MHSVAASGRPLVEAWEGRRDAESVAVTAAAWVPMTAAVSEPEMAEAVVPGRRGENSGANSPEV